MSAASVGSIFGGHVQGTTTSITGTGSPLCTFIVQDSTGASQRVVVSWHPGVSNGGFRTAQTTALAHGAVAVPGLGDSAYYSAAAVTVQFISGDSSGAVQVSPVQPTAGVTASAATLRNDVVALAQQVVRTA